MLLGGWLHLYITQLMAFTTIHMPTWNSFNLMESGFELICLPASWPKLCIPVLHAWYLRSFRRQSLSPATGQQRVAAPQTSSRAGAIMHASCPSLGGRGWSPLCLAGARRHGMACNCLPLSHLFLGSLLLLSLPEDAGTRRPSLITTEHFFQAFADALPRELLPAI
jgi:hypothetical protein